MNDTQDNPRQAKILQHLASKATITRKDVESIFPVGSVSRITLIRDLNELITRGWVQQSGGGKYVRYSLIPGKELFIPIHLDDYFKDSVDVRPIRYPSFNSAVTDTLVHLFTPQDTKIFEEGKQMLHHRFSIVDPVIIKRELERFTIEFSWKSSQIEGNTYSLLETEELIKNKREAKGHSKEEAVMILNHKSAFDTILEHRSTFRKVSELDIRSIHKELVKDLDITLNIREYGVGITGTMYKPLDTKWQLEEALHAVIEHAKTLSIPEQSLVFLLMISYIQPFADGNKRTARMVSNALLLANGYYPLSYRSVDEVEFKKALILFYEQNNLYHLKRMFLEQQKFAMQQYFT